MCDALHYVAQTGNLVYVGITTQELAFEQRFMHRPEMTIKASRNARPENFTRIIDLIEKGVIDTDPWITHRTSFDDVVGEFETFTRPESGVLKAMIEVKG
jgi:alcohol dehydrogenase